MSAFGTYAVSATNSHGAALPSGGAPDTTVIIANLRHDGISALPADADEDDGLLATTEEARRGDVGGIRRFLTAITPTVARTCRRIVGPNHPDLQDAIQESLYASVQALHRYRSDGGIHSYVAAIALRKALAVRRVTSARWRQHAEIESDDLIASGADAPDSLLDGLNMVRRVLDGVRGLPAETLLMRLVLGMSIEEIARSTGATPAAVKARLRRGKNTLRREAGAPRFWRKLFSGTKLW